MPGGRINLLKHIPRQNGEARPGSDPGKVSIIIAPDRNV